VGVKVKICGITNLDDALVAAKAGADALGFLFYKESRRYISPRKTKAIIAQLPKKILKAGVFVNAQEKEIRWADELCRFDLLQFHGDETPDFCAGFGLPFLRAVRVRAGTDLLQYAREFHAAKGLLLDAWVEGARGGTGTTFDWSLIPGDLPAPVVLSGGLNPDNVEQAVRRVRPWAVDVSSGVESAKGIKDVRKMEAFMTGVRNAGI